MSPSVHAGLILPRQGCYGSDVTAAMLRQVVSCSSTHGLAIPEQTAEFPSVT